MKFWLDGGLRLFAVAFVAAVPFMAVGWLVSGGSGMLLGGMLAMVGMALAWAGSLPLLLRMASAEIVRAGEQRHLVTTVQRLARASRMQTPIVAISQLPLPNAMAAITPHGPIVCVTEGLVQMLAPDELEAVIAHELAHLAQPGRRAATLAAAVAAIPGWFSVHCGTDLYFESGYRRSRSPLWNGEIGKSVRSILTLSAAIPAAVLVRVSAVRADELNADRLGVAMTDRPLAMAEALRNLQALAGRIVFPVNPALSHLLVMHPFGSPAVSRIFNTHPDTVQRLTALDTPGT